MKKIILTLLALSFPLTGLGQEIYLETRSVKTASLLPQKIILTITKQDIVNSSAINITDLLAQYGLVNIQRRGAFDLQGDISIRGATFDQSIIKINGLSVSDPQTGHHNLDIPVPLESIECIEVTTEAINIVTTKLDHPRLKIGLLGGQHYLRGGNLAINNFTYQHLSSNGWRDNTEFKDDTLHYQQVIPSAVGPCDISLGYIRKDFGAYKFYSQNYPDEKETTSTLLATGKIEFFTGSLYWQPQTSLRLHRDYFILDRNRPDWSFNDHRNSTIFFGLPVTWPIRQHKLITSLDFKQDAINSTNLQQHHRNAYSWSTRFIPRLGDFGQIELELREDWYDPKLFRRIFRTTATIHYALTEYISWLAGVDRFYRLPTFTELYYFDPANKGSASLEAEKGWNYQTGLKYQIGQISWQNIVFCRTITNAIDWVRSPEETLWQAKNISMIKAYGLESSFALTTQLKVNYQYLNNRLTAVDYLSKYNTNYLKHNASLHFGYTLPGQIKNDWVAMYRQPSQLSSYMLFDLKISRSFGLNWTAYISGTNLLNTYYEEITGLPRPGRWLMVGLSWEI